MSHTKGDNRTALKLINKYADSHNILVEENKALKTEINDLRANIRINKEIIEGFFNQSNSKDKQNIVLTKCREESAKLYKQNELLNKDINSLHQKYALIEQTTSEALSMAKDENETLKMKIFALEQTIIRKDNLIMQIKKKSYQKDDEFGYIEKEIYVTDPSKAIVYINDELIMYKEIYENLLNHIKEGRESLMKAEAMVADLQKENSKLKLKFKYQQICANREKETLMNAVQQERCLSNTRNVTDKSNKSVLSNNTPNYRTIMLTDDNLLFKKIRLNNRNSDYNITSDSTKSTAANKYGDKEFTEIIKQAGLRQADYEKFTKTKSCAKLIEIIEMMYTLITDKRMTINLLKQENEKLTTKNYQLNRDNMVLFQQNVDFKQQILNYNNNNSNSNNRQQDRVSNNNPESLINNTSQITNNIQINTALLTYHKLIKTEEKNGDISDALEEECVIDSSRHDSIVYTKNMKEDAINEISKRGQAKQVLSPHLNDREIGREEGNRINRDNIDSNSNSNNNKHNMMTIESVTSSEFRDGCKGINSFVITIRENNNQSSVEYDGEAKLNNINIKTTNL